MTARAGTARLRFYNALVEAGCEVRSLVDRGLGLLTQSRHYDARCDRRVEAIDRLAYRGAVEAEALNEPTLLLIFGRIRQECAGYRQDDAGETGAYEAGVGLFRRICSILRGVNRSLERELARRKGSRT